MGAIHTQIIAILISGLATGLLYGLVGLGLVIVYRTSRVLNFAQGDVVTVAAYLAYTLFSMHLSYGVASLLTILGGGVIGFLFFMVAITPLSLRRRDWLKTRGIHDERTILNLIIGTLAASIILEGLEVYIWGSSVISFRGVFGQEFIHLGRLAVSDNSIAIIVISAVLLAGLGLFFNRTRVGMAMQGAYENALGAELVGINVYHIYALSWVISGVLAAVAALLATPVTYLTSTSLVLFMFTAFAAIILGGLSSFQGAIIGGVTFGVINNLIATYLSTQLEQVFVFFVVITVLLVRPHGLFANKKEGYTRV